MIDYYYAIAKHNDVQRAASVRRPAAPDYDANYQEILDKAQMHRAIMLKRIVRSAWVMLRKAVNHQAATDGFAGKRAVG